ncbi:Hist-deacetyl domain-containing protein [Mycena chlorophos]|uniref:histone deacetylase n=1 Tax=Mycena chlorophos TaxID=658473 RepID=A0A8H6TKD6_MYCCL|nr:Hist-deacetyl domain-containing protein [Mycena chlorophos]
MEDPRPVVAYIASKELMQISSLLPSNPQRSTLVHTLARSLNLYSREFSTERFLQLVPPQKAERSQLNLYHTDDYLNFVLNPDNADELSKTEYGLEEDCPLFRGVSLYVELVGGAAITAVKTLQHPRWGRHHAKKNSASGFCYVADCVLAIMQLRRLAQQTPSGPRKPRIMYLDLDLHFSDGVSQAFHQTSSTSPNILTLSIHHTAPGFFPSTPLADLPTPTSDPFTLSLPLQQGASNATFLRAWACVERIRTAFDPDFVVVQCGVDSLAGDPHAIFNWSLGPCDDISGRGSLGWCVSRVLNHPDWRGKKLLLGGGGYDSPNAARAWAYLTSIALGNPLPLNTEIPSDETNEFFPQYAPSFTLDVPAGTMQDRNTDEYLRSVERVFEEAAIAIQQRLTAT